MAQKRVSASEMLSDLKSRLGFAHDSERDDDEYSRYDDYDDYSEYDDYDDDYDYGDYGDEYESENRSVSPSARSSRSSTSSRSSRFGRPDSSPHLVSIDDVRENRSIIDSPRGSYESAHRERTGNYVPATVSADNNYTSTYQRNAQGRNLVEASGPAVSSPAYNAAQRSNSARSEGLNSLFESTAADNTRYATSSAIGGERGITVIKPQSYNDVEGVARALKAGDVVVLAMSSTPDDLYLRILDFSFGVASALDAHVDGLAERVYALATGPEITTAERERLHTQGIL